MDSYFFRVEHDLLRSQAFQQLGGSAIKVYLVIGLHSDFGTGWAYPSVRTIARQAGLSRQTVLASIKELAATGLLAASKSPGRSTAYRILHAPERPAPGRGSRPGASKSARTRPESLGVPPKTGPISLGVGRPTGPNSLQDLAQFLDHAGPADRPKREPETRNEDTTSIPIPGTPFRLTAEGRLLVSVDLQELLTSQGISPRLAERLSTQKDPEAVAKVLLNALYLQSQGKLQNGPGYIRAALEDGYDLLPQVASRLETRRRELETHLRQLESRRRLDDSRRQQAEEEQAINLLLEQLDPEDLDQLVGRAVASLPPPLVRRNPTLSNPFVRAKVYEMAGGEPAHDSP
jgi:hypothetical protein